MAEPISTLVIVAAGGAAAKSVMEKAWSSGEKFLARYFQDHQPAAAAKAEQNAREFVDNLALKVSELEEQQRIDREVIDRAFDDPSFSATLHAALVSSAQTERAEKHDILARLIIERIRTSSETTKAAAIRIACVAVNSLTTPQFAALATFCALSLGAPHFSETAQQREEQFLNECDDRIRTLLTPFAEIRISFDDLLHLVSTNCATFQALTTRSKEGLKGWSAGQFRLDLKALMELPVAQEAKPDALKFSQNFSPTPAGKIVGRCVLSAAGVSDIEELSFS